MKNIFATAFILTALLLPPGPVLAQPSPTPLPEVSLELYFRRPGLILSGPEFAEPVIVEELPFVDQEDFSRARVVEREGRPHLYLEFSPAGRERFSDNRWGNIGRTVVVAVDGEARNTFELTVHIRGRAIELDGDFTFQEAEAIARWINARHPSPDPSPTPSPTPAGTPPPGPSPSP